ncbi:MAG: hypothetical protein M3Y50_07105 [Acidobacteriota bacterium]|nr:hypothetical protein [Acidobacteriota bacterium]
MKPLTMTNILLLAIVILLLAIVVKPFDLPRPVQAQSAEPYPFYLEPGTYMLRAPDGSSQVYGKVAVDLRNGKIWGLPTLGPQPFPINMVDNKPQTTRPFALGRFAFEDTNK